MSKTAQHGRYDRVATTTTLRERPDGAREWTTEDRAGPTLPREGERAGGKLRIRHGAIADPNAARPGERRRVAINMHTDALETEYAYKRISEAAYRAGRLYQAILEASRGRRTYGSSFEPRGDRANAIRSCEHALIRRLETAQDAVDMLTDARSAIGAWGELVLTGVLGEGLTLAEMTAKAGRKGSRARSEIARAFREGLEALADHWEKRGGPARRDL